MGRMKMRGSGLSLMLAAVMAAGGSPAADAQRLPFAPGEHAVYDVRLGAVPAGTGTLSVTGRQTVDGEQTYHTVMTLRDGNALYRLNNRYESWIDTDGLFSRRFHQNPHEGRHRRDRRWDFDPERRTYLRENGDTGTMPTREPLDDLSSCTMPARCRSSRAPRTGCTATSSGRQSGDDPGAAP